MRLKVFDRVVLVLIIVAVALLTIGFIASMFVPSLFDTAVGLLRSIYSSVFYKIAAMVAALAILFLCGRILFVRKPKEPGKPPVGVTISTSEGGSAYLTVAAIEGIVTNIVQENRLIKQSRVSVLPAQDSVSVGVTITLPKGINVKDVTTRLQESISNGLVRMTGVKVKEVRIIVEDANDGEAAAEDKIVLDTALSAPAQEATVLPAAQAETDAEA